MAVLRLQRRLVSYCPSKFFAKRHTASSVKFPDVDLKGTGLVDKAANIEDDFPAPTLVFDSPLLADALDFGADSDKVNISVGCASVSDAKRGKESSPEGMERIEIASDSIVCNHQKAIRTLTGTDWVRPERRAVAMALQRAEALPPPRPFSNPPVRQPVRASDMLAESVPHMPQDSEKCETDVDVDSIESELGPIYTWTSAMQEEFVKVFASESRRSGHDDNLKQGAAQMEAVGPSLDFEALSDQLVGEWESVHERGRLRIHVIERDGFGGLSQRSRDVGASRKLGQIAESLRVRIRLQPSGEVFWGQGDVTLDKSSLGEATLIWRHRNGHMWEWIRRAPIGTIGSNSSTKRDESPKLLERLEDPRALGATLEENFSVTLPIKTVGVEKQVNPIVVGDTMKEESCNELVRLCHLTIEAFTNDRQLQRKPSLPFDALHLARKHAAVGDAVTLAAELFSIERNGLRRHQLSRDPVRAFVARDERRVREDTIQVLFTGVPALSWPRLRALLLTGVRTTGGSTLSGARV